MRWLSVLLVAYILVPVPFALDDAYIVLHNARVLVAGSDPIYHSSALTGSTSPPFLLAVAAGYAAGLSEMTSLRLIVGSGIAAYAIGVWTLAGVYVRDWRRFAVSIIALGGEWLWRVLTNGLETGLAVALVVCMIVWWHRRQSWALTIGCGVLPCLRPELLPLAGLFGVALLHQRRRAAVPQAALALAIVIACASWLRLETGQWWPQTMDAKRLFFTGECRPTSAKIHAFTIYAGLWAVALFPLSAGLFGTVRTAIGRIGLVGITIALIPFVVAFPEIIVVNDYRYLAPILIPWAVLGLASSVRNVWPVALMIAVILSAGVFISRPPRVKPQAHEVQAMGQWIHTNTPPDAIVLTHDAGGVAYWGQRRAVDMVGLKSPESIPAHRRWTFPSCGAERDKAIAAIATATQATHLVTVRSFEKWLHIREGLERDGFTLDALRIGEGPEGYIIDRISARPVDGSQPNP